MIHFILFKYIDIFSIRFSQIYNTQGKIFLVDKSVILEEKLEEITGKFNLVS